MIVSGDRDVYQLVRDGVRVMTTSRGVTDTKIYDHDGVVERYGVPPDRVTDFIGLKGDTSDNIPGVPGIGDKTAAQLLQQFGDLEGVLSSVDEISGAKRKQNLTEHADDARVSKQLATMVEDIDVPIVITSELRGSPDRSKLRDAANEFELRAVVQRLDDEWEEVVPGRMVEETIEVEAKEGTVADLADGPISMAISGGRWAASDGSERDHRRRHRSRRPRRRSQGPAADRPRPQGPRRSRRHRACSPPRARARSISPTTRWSPPT